MFIIFGIKRLVRRLATLFAMCSQCGSPAAQVVARRSTWFSLFFIPVVPLGSKYFTTCTLCGVATRLDKEQALHLVALAGQSSNQAPHVMPPTDALPIPPTSAPPPGP
ncbi:MAG TPA: zinc-ribbon domain-containing protein [Acidimicrobiales bacterium]|nr:zinc-ribbon domain-containing protein [Acidimicrobiales bacterium]